MTYLSDPIIGQDLVTTGLTPLRTQTLGTLFKAIDGVYMYVQAPAAVAQYALVKISNTFTIAEGTTTLLPSTEPARVGIAQVAFAAGEYGWVFVGPGLATCKVAASCVQDVKLYTTATAGVVDDAATTQIQGLKLITTITTAAASPVVAETELSTAS